jgi:hypothetical protein
MEVSGRLRDLATLSPGKETLVPIGGWAQEPVWTRWWGKDFQPLPGLETPIIQLVAQVLYIHMCSENVTESWVITTAYRVAEIPLPKFRLG